MEVCPCRTLYAAFFQEISEELVSMEGLKNILVDFVFRQEISEELVSMEATYILVEVLQKVYFRRTS